MSILELRAKRAKLVSDARQILKKASDEKRNLRSTETETYDRISADVDALGAQIEREERQTAVELSLRESAGRVVPAENVSAGYNTEERTAFRAFLRGEQRAGMNSTDANGGAMIAPPAFHNQLVEVIRESTVLYNLASKLSVSGSSIEVPSFTGDSIAGQWLDEQESITPTDASGFVRNALTPKKLGVLQAVSNEMLKDSAVDVESFLARHLGGALAATAETALFSGTALAGQPLGIVAAASAGVTAEDTTDIEPEEIIALFYSLPSQYRQRASFIVSPQVAQKLRSMRTTAGDFLWSQQALISGQPETLLGQQVRISSNLDNPAAGKVPVLFGDFSYYYVAEKVNGLELERNPYALFASDQTQFRCIYRLDGKLLLPAAVKKLTMAAE